ncbi:MAG: ABC transporter permease [Chitinophagaceae bacterium]
MQLRLRTIFRSFMRHKTAFFINLAGLSMGLAAALLIYLWVDDELHVDKFHENDSRLFQLMSKGKQGDEVIIADGTSAFLGDALKRDLPEVQYAVTTTPAAWFRHFDLSYNNAAVDAKGNFAGKDFFNVFSYHLFAGNSNTVLAEPNTVAISRDMAVKLFHSADNALGKTISWKWASFTRECLVTGVFENVPANSTVQFDFIVSIATWKTLLPGNGNVNQKEELVGGPFHNYVVIKKGTDETAFQHKVAGYLASKVPGIKGSLQPVRYSDFYLYGLFENGVQKNGRIEYVRLFSFIAIFILIIACINFMNLSTAKAVERIKETGIKKILGANRWSLVWQFFTESIWMSCMALVIALVLVMLLLPQFNSITGKHIILHANGRIITTVIAMVLTTALVAGTYPALYLSGFNPVQSLKGTIIPSGKSVWMRKGLTGFQFMLSFVFIVMVMVVYNQVKFIQDKQPGYNRDNVISFEMTGKVSENPAAFITGVKNIPGVIQASTIQNSIILPTFTPLPGVYWEGKNADDAIRFYQMPVNYDMIELLDIPVKEGRSFSRSFGMDTASVVLNEAAVEAMGIQDPIGKNIKVWGYQRQIIGVTKNFHFNSLHETVKPFIFKLEPASTMLMMVKMTGAGEGNTLRAIQQYYRDFNPGYSFNYAFLDEEYSAQYVSETLTGTLAKYFAGMAIVISCLGLFGLAAFMVEKKTKEIGIRKTLGAGAFSIVYLLSAEFTRIILWAVLIALPVSYWICHQWLNDFAYHISLTPVYFIAAIIITILIAWGTVSIQTIKAAVMNPVKALKG